MEIVDVISNLGVPVGVLVYFMWYNNTVMKDFTEQLKELNTNIVRMIENNDEKKDGL